MAVLLRREVLRKYREILRVSSSWKALEEAETAAERQFIREEARRLFRKNKQLSDVTEIQQCLDEATARLEMGFCVFSPDCLGLSSPYKALHYGNPYPRPVNFAPGYVVSTGDKKTQAQRQKDSSPLYTHSLDK